VVATPASPPPAFTEAGDAGVATTSVPTPSAEDEDDDLPRPGKVWDNSGPSLSELLKQQQSAPPPPSLEPVAATPAASESNVEAVDPNNLPVVWQKLLDVLAEKGPGLPGLLSHGRYIGLEDGKCVVRYAKQHETFVKMFERNGKKDQVREAFSKVLNQSVGITFDLEADATSAIATTEVAPKITANTPPAKAVSPTAVRREAVRAPAATPAPAPVRLTDEQIAALRESDPLIKSIMDELGAQVIKIE
ncbi:MAG: hypothetical protein WBD40_12235, partial [Tepidisphaeraceae bacterium]